MWSLKISPEDAKYFFRVIILNIILILFITLGLVTVSAQTRQCDYDTDMTTVGYSISGGNWVQAKPASYAYDNDEDTFTAHNINAWLGQDFGFDNEQDIGRIHMYRHNESVGIWMCRQYSIQYSDNGSEWTDTGLDTEYLEKGEDAYVDVNSGEHRYWRLVENGNGDSSCTEVEMFSCETIDPTATPTIGPAQTLIFSGDVTVKEIEPYAYSSMDLATLVMSTFGFLLMSFLLVIMVLRSRK